MMEKRTTVEWLLLLCFAAAIALPHSAAAQRWTPQRHVEFVAPAGAGGSMDTAMRTVEQVVRELKAVPVSTGVVNRAGGEHAVAYTYLQQRPGDPHLLCLTSTVLLTNHISGVLPLTYTDVTPVATLIGEYYLFVVGKDSPFKSAKDLIEALKQRPESVSVAGGNLPQRMAIGQVLQAVGADIKRVKIVTISGAKTTLTVAGGHVDAGVAAPGQALSLIESGLVRPIAISGPKRVGGSLAAVPTWAELGVSNAEYTAWRAVIAPKGLTAAQVEYWEDVMRRVTESAEFQKVAEKHQWDISFRGAADARKFMEAEYAQFKRVMSFMGIVK